MSWYQQGSYVSEVGGGGRVQLLNQCHLRYAAASPTNYATPLFARPH